MTDNPRKVSDAQRKQRIAAGKARGRKNESVRSAKKSGKQTFDAKAVADEIARYEAMDLPIDTWNDVKAKLQAKHQAQENQHKLNLYRIETGDLITRTEHEDTIKGLRDVVLEAVARTLIDAVVNAAPTVDRPHWRKTAGNEVLPVILQAIKDAIANG